MLRLILDILSGSFVLQFTERMICTNLILLENLTSLRLSMRGESAQLPASGEIMDVVAAFLKLQYAPCIFNSCGLGLPKSWHQR